MKTAPVAAITWRTHQKKRPAVGPGVSPVFCSECSGGLFRGFRNGQLLGGSYGIGFGSGAHAAGSVEVAVVVRLVERAHHHAAVGGRVGKLAILQVDAHVVNRALAPAEKHQVAGLHFGLGHALVLLNMAREE